jgi:hypothetical protein
MNISERIWADSYTRSGSKNTENKKKCHRSEQIWADHAQIRDGGEASSGFRGGDAMRRPDPSGGGAQIRPAARRPAAASRCRSSGEAAGASVWRGEAAAASGWSGLPVVAARWSGVGEGGGNGAGLGFPVCGMVLYSGLCGLRVEFEKGSGLFCKTATHESPTGVCGAR